MVAQDVENAFWNCAGKSDLYIGPGGGERFPRATEKRVARFENDGSQVPLWMNWIPLAAQYSQVPASERQEWERHNIPANAAERQDLEEADYQSRLYQLSDQEIALVCGFRELGTDEQSFLCRITQPEMLQQVIAILRDSTSPPPG